MSGGLIPSELRAKLKPLPKIGRQPTARVDQVLLCLVDVSGSMAEPIDAGLNKIKVAWQALKVELQPRLAGWNLGIILFGTLEPDPGVQWLQRPARSPDLAKLKEPRAQGDTPLLSALEEAWKWLEARAEGPRRILVISDGLPNRGGGPQEVLDEAGKHQDICIDTIAIGPCALWNPGFLARLSALTQGRAVVVGNAAQLAEEMRALSPAERPVLGEPEPAGEQA